MRSVLVLPHLVREGEKDLESEICWCELTSMILSGPGIPGKSILHGDGAVDGRNEAIDVWETPSDWLCLFVGPDKLNSRRGSSSLSSPQIPILIPNQSLISISLASVSVKTPKLTLPW